MTDGSVAPAPAAGLRSLQLFNLAFGVAIGIGWIMLVGTWLAAGGPLGAGLAFALAALAMLTISSSYAAVAIDSPLAGGEFAYARSTFGPAVGFWVGWFLALTYVVVLAFEIVSLGWIARELFHSLPAAPPAAAGHIAIDAVGLAIGAAVLACVVALNLEGAAAAARLQDVLVFLKVALSLALIVAGLAFGRVENLLPLWGNHASGSAAQGALVVLAMAPFFYAGFGVVAQALGGAATPQAMQALPRVMTFVILGTMTFYVLIIVAVAAVAPRAAILEASLPAAAAFTLGLGSGAVGKAVLILGLFGLLTLLNGVFFAAVLLIQALAQAGLLPPRFGIVNPRTGIARTTGLFVAISAMLLAALGKQMLSPLINVASAALCGVMAVVCAVLIRRRRLAGARKRSLLIPAAGVLLACAMVAVALAQASVASKLRVPPEWLVIAGWTVLGLALIARAPRQRAASDPDSTRP